MRLSFPTTREPAAEKRRRPAVFLPKILAVCALAVLAQGGASEAAFKLPLMTGWKVLRAQEPGNLPDRFYRESFPDAAWQEATIVEGKVPYKERWIFYRLRFRVPAEWKGREIRLHIGGADDEATAWLNGVKLGEHKGWEEAFEFDVSALARCGQSNLLAVMCRNSNGGPGGLWRSVYLCLPKEIEKIQLRRRAALRERLKKLAGKYRIVYETYRGDNWELYSIRPDGSEPMNLTRTPTVNELYPHVSPDGKRVCFVVDETLRGKKTRNVYFMNLDGTGRVRVAENARQPCWSPDGTKIAFLKGEYEKFTYLDYATKGLYFYDLKTGRITAHPNPKLYHLYNICWAPNGRWFASTVHGGMGFSHAIIAFEAQGERVINLGLGGCRPDFSPDRVKIGWGRSDWELHMADVDWSGGAPRPVNERMIASSRPPMKIYHLDWSPDGRYIAFSRGPKKKRLGLAPEMVGLKAAGWNICVGDAEEPDVWVEVTSDGNCNKEPDWMILPTN